MKQVTNNWTVTTEWQLNGDVPSYSRSFDNFTEAYEYYCIEAQDKNLAQYAEYSAAEMVLTAKAAGNEWAIFLTEG